MCQLGDGYLIPKSRARQLGDYAIRLFATPVTVVVDKATIVAVAGVLILGNYRGPPIHFYP